MAWRFCEKKGGEGERGREGEGTKRTNFRSAGTSLQSQKLRQGNPEFKGILESITRPSLKIGKINQVGGH